MWMYEIICNDCKQIQRWEFENTTGGMIPHHCGNCGSSNIKQQRFDNYWYDLAESFGFERSENGAEFIHGLYRLWKPSEHRMFKDFVKVALESAD